MTNICVAGEDNSQPQTSQVHISTNIFKDTNIEHA